MVCTGSYIYINQCTKEHASVRQLISEDSTFDFSGHQNNEKNIILYLSHPQLWDRYNMPN